MSRLMYHQRIVLIWLYWGLLYVLIWLVLGSSCSLVLLSKLLLLLHHFQLSGLLSVLFLLLI